MKKNSVIKDYRLKKTPKRPPPKNNDEMYDYAKRTNAFVKNFKIKYLRYRFSNDTLINCNHCTLLSSGNVNT